MSTVDKAALLASRRPGRATITIPGIGDITVRGLTRAEVLLVEALEGGLAQERRSLALALVEPRLTDAEVEQWQRNAPAGEFQAVAAKVLELSGMGPGAAKEATKSPDDESSTGV